MSDDGYDPVEALSPLEEDKPLIVQERDEPFVAYSLLCLYLQMGEVAKINEKAASLYIAQNFGVEVPPEEILKWPTKYEWESRIEKARFRVTRRINTAFKYHDDVQKQLKWKELADRREKLQGYLDRMDARMPDVLEHIPTEDYVKTYVDLAKLQVTLGKAQREERGENNTSVNVNIEVILEEMAKKEGRSPEFIEAVKAQAIQQLYGENNALEAEYTAADDD